jgi:hypothetical protein
MNYKLNWLKREALQLQASDLRLSTRKNKRLMVVYRGHRIHFGSKTGKTFIDHQNKDLRRAWYARHSKIKNSSGEYVIDDPSSPSYWSARILWPLI